MADLTRTESFGTLKEKLPEQWKTKDFIGNDGNRRLHSKDEYETIRVRTDPPDRVTDYPHMHIFDELGNPLDQFGNIVDKSSPDAHIPWDGK